MEDNAIKHLAGGTPHTRLAASMPVPPACLSAFVNRHSSRQSPLCCAIPGGSPGMAPPPASNTSTMPGTTSFLPACRHTLHAGCFHFCCRARNLLIQLQHSIAARQHTPKFCHMHLFSTHGLAGWTVLNAHARRQRRRARRERRAFSLDTCCTRAVRRPSVPSPQTPAPGIVGGTSLPPKTLAWRCVGYLIHIFPTAVPASHAGSQVLIARRSYSYARATSRLCLPTPRGFSLHRTTVTRAGSDDNRNVQLRFVVPMDVQCGLVCLWRYRARCPDSTFSSSPLS